MIDILKEQTFVEAGAIGTFGRLVSAINNMPNQVIFLFKIEVLVLASSNFASLASGAFFFRSLRPVEDAAFST